MTELVHLLNSVEERILKGDGTEAVAVLCDGLRTLRNSLSDNLWVSEVIASCRSHPVLELLLQDPYTSRAFRKPRGYAGDAEMLDYIYSGEPPIDTTSIGRSVFRGTTGLPNGISVVERRDILSKKIDSIAASRSHPKVLSIACGHLRECQSSSAISKGLIAEFVALDQDAASLEFVRREMTPLGVKVIQSSVLEIIRKRITFSGFDFVYAAGLFDYLSNELGKRLFATMFEMLQSQGRLLIANFVPDNHGRGYMECFMDWHLICRDETQMKAFLAAIDSEQMADYQLYRDTQKNVLYLEVLKS